MKKYLYLMRHGETQFNKLDKIQGWCDSPLTQQGIHQAEVAAKYIQDVTFGHYYSSTSERCCDTLEIIIKDKPYKRLKGLREINFGSFEGESQRLNPKTPKEHETFFVGYGGEVCY